MNAYQMLGEKTGTPEARDLAVELQAWHDSMVMHQRAVTSRGEECDDECPHSQAQVLWPIALATFGERASELVLLQKHGTAAQGHTMTGRAARVGS